MDVLRKAGAIPSQDIPNEDSSGMSFKGTTSESSVHANSSEPEYIEVSMAAKSLEVQRYKFRPLLVDCFSILSFSQVRLTLSSFCYIVHVVVDIPGMLKCYVTN